VGQAAGHDRDRDVQVEHFSGHEVAEIMEPAVADPGCGAGGDGRWRGRLKVAID
jgi:hypothetical protein